jgi:hypothetical protein
MNSDRQDAPARARWARRAATMLMGGAIAAGGLAAAAAPAHAAPSGCTTTSSAGTYTAKCTEGDGQYRILLQCAMYRSGKWYSATVTGPWATAGPDGSSSARCPSGYGLFQHHILFG